MKFEYTFEGMTLKVLDETFAGKVLEFYSSNREEFDRYEVAKPDNFYTTEYIAATLKAEYAALLKGEFGRFFLFSDDLPGEILGSVSFFGVTSINRSCRIGYKIDKNYRQLGLGSLMVKHMLEILTHEKEMHRIEAYIHPQNISSINLVKSLGFISEGTAYSYVKLNGSWQDHLRFVYIS